jgi:sucrose-6-phosphate hydrolase SacC (GH32 family)
MALYLTGNTYGLFASQDLIHWTRLSTVTMPGSSECPDMFELPVVGEPGAARWIFVGGDGRYLIGRFDGNQFLPEAGPLQVEYGPNFYATQTWNDAPRSRRIQIAWMAGGQYPNMPFNQQLTLPFELTLRRTPDGLRMFREPIREFTRLRGHATKLPTTLIGPSRSLRISAPSDLVEMHVVLEIAECQRVVLQMGDVEVSYSVKDGRLQAMGRSCPLRLENGRLSLHLIRDRTSLEVIAGNGAATFSGCIPPARDHLHIEISVEGGTGKLVSGTLWPIKPALEEAGAETAH